MPPMVRADGPEEQQIEDEDGEASQAESRNRRSKTLFGADEYIESAFP